MKREELKAWAQASGRTYLIMRMDELIDSLPYPEGAEKLQDVVQAYERHRAMMPSELTDQPGDRCGQKIDASRGKGACLEPSEIRDLIAFLQSQLPAHSPD